MAYDYRQDSTSLFWTVVACSALLSIGAVARYLDIEIPIPYLIVLGIAVPFAALVPGPNRLDKHRSLLLGSLVIILVLTFLSFFY